MARPSGPPSGPPRQPPISFKTVPGRNRTQKWNQAKQYNYDGDDWGGYDPYDEYAGQEEPLSMHGGPYPQPAMQRQQSFEAGGERQQFSAGQPSYHNDRSGSPAKSTGSSGYSDRGQGRPREYSNPAQVPPALNTRMMPPAAERSRKNSVDSDQHEAMSPQSAKPLPFIRPSDIYKRMAEEKEKERQSFDSSRPSMESITREDTPASVTSSAHRPLSTVQERPGSGDISTLIAPETADLHPGYGSTIAHPVHSQVVSDADRNVKQTTTSSNTAPADRVAQAPGLQNIVQTAFDRQNSTATSLHSSTAASDVSRSNTDSTGAISPIMSRVPRDQEPFPAIAEHPEASHSRSVSGETIVGPTHSKYTSLDAAATVPPTASMDNAYRRSLNASSPAQSVSPARTPAIEQVETRRLSGPMAAEIAAEAEPVITGRPRRGTDYSIREADLAEEASMQKPDHTSSLANTQRSMQDNFLHEHAPATVDTVPVSQPPAQPSRLGSFQPHMPGEWISPAPTPSIETPQPSMQPTVQPSRLAQSTTVDDDVPDFSPTTSRDHHSDDAVSSAINAVKDAGSALGAALLSTAGLGHQTKDFASDSPAPVAQPDARARNQTGDVASRLPIYRMASDAPTESNVSVFSDVPPTPPAKDPTAPAAIQTSFAPSVPQPQTMTPQTSRALSSEYESDRLSKDIMQSLGHHNVSQDRQAASQSVGLTLSDSQPTARDPSATRPGLLDQRFSWESVMPEPAPVATAPVALPVPAPTPAPAEPVVQLDPIAPALPIAVVGELPHDKDRQSFERPSDGQALHIVNAPKDELVSPIEEERDADRSPVSPISMLHPLPTFQQTLDVPTADTVKSNDLSSRPVSLDDSSHIPSYYAGVTDANFEPTRTPEILQQPDEDAVKAVESAPSTSVPPVSAPDASRHSGRIPPFREILAMKEAPERIKTYTETRQSFAEMNTGLSVWMNGLLAKHPEHSNMVNDRGGFNTDTIQHDGSMGRGHRHNPSILKLNPFNVGDASPDTPSKDHADSRQQMEKMQAKGKDLMKTASAFSGKAQAGAMGLLAKGRNKFGRGDKAKSSQTPTHPPRRSSRTLSSDVLMTEVARDLTGSNHAATFSEPLADNTLQDSREHAVISPGDDSGAERKSGFFARLRRRSRSLTGTPRPASTMLGTTDDALELSKTRSASRSRSRPRSLILLFGNKSDDARTDERRLISMSSSTPEDSAVLNKTRTETWEHTDALPRVSEGNEDGGLGVLPSPSTFVFQEDSASPQRQRKSSLTAKPTERDGLDDERRPDTSGSVVRHPLPPLPVETVRAVQESPSEKPLPPIPMQRHQRRSSDLSTLPSQIQANDVAPVPSWERSGSPVLDPTTKRYSFPLQAVLTEHDAEEMAEEEEESSTRPGVNRADADVVAGAEDTPHRTTIQDGHSAFLNDTSSAAVVVPRTIAETGPLSGSLDHGPSLDRQSHTQNKPTVSHDVTTSSSLHQEAVVPESTKRIPDSSGDAQSIVSAHDEAVLADTDKHSVRSNRSAVSSLVEPVANTKGPDDQPHELNQRATSGPAAQRPVLNSPLESYSTVFRPLDQLDLQPAQRAAELTPHFEERPIRPIATANKPHSYLPLPEGVLEQPLQQAFSHAEATISATQQESRLQDTQLAPKQSAFGTNTAATHGQTGEGSRPLVSTFPSSSQINDQYGLEDAQQAMIVEDPHHDNVDVRRDKRRSGLWDTLRKVSSSNQHSTDGDSKPLAKVDRRQTFDKPSKSDDGEVASGVQRRPQRSSSVAADIQLKKKRFSNLGSIFGRTSVSSDAATKPNRLSKKAPPLAERSATIEQPTQGYHQEQAAPANYQDYEAFRRRQSAYEATASTFVQNTRRPDALKTQRRTQSSTTIPVGSSQMPVGRQAHADSQQRSHTGPDRPMPSSNPSYELQNEWYWSGQSRGIPEAFRSTRTSSARIPPITHQSGQPGRIPFGEPGRQNWPLRGESTRQIPSEAYTPLNGQHGHDSPSGVRMVVGNTQVASPVSSMPQHGDWSQSDSQPTSLLNQDQRAMPRTVHRTHARTSDTPSNLPSLDSTRYLGSRESRSQGASEALSGAHSPPQVRDGDTTATSGHSRSMYEPQMRGSSYPGQEWMPHIHGHS